jgi:hypothetical protein
MNDEWDDARDEFYEQVSAEAIEQFTVDRLQSYYTTHPEVMRPAVDAVQEAKKLLELERPAAAVVFSASAIELLLKATILKPVVHGLVHNATLAEIIVDSALGQTGFGRYDKLLASLFLEFAKIDLHSIRRSNSDQTLLSKCKTIQEWRNKVMHQGEKCTLGQASIAFEVAVDTYNLIVKPVLGALGLTVGDNGVIERR